MNILWKILTAQDAHAAGGTLVNDKTTQNLFYFLKIYID